jgi:hypothetical protein
VKEGFVGEVIKLSGKELEEAHNHYFEKIRTVKGILDVMESTFHSIDIIKADEIKGLTAFVWADTTLDKALVTFEEGVREIEKIMDVKIY